MFLQSQSDSPGELSFKWWLNEAGCSEHEASSPESPEEGMRETEASV